MKDPRHMSRVLHRDAYQQPRPTLACKVTHEDDPAFETRCEEWARRIEIELRNRNWAGARHVIEMAERSE